MRKSVIYTAIFGEYDGLIEPVAVGNDVDYVCFTDSAHFTSDIWQIREMEPYMPDDPVRSARLVKICPHRFLPEYEFSLWVDGNMRINRVPDIPRLLDGKNIAMEWHRKRNCLYDEANVCKMLMLDDADAINRQLDAFRAMGIPEGQGLYASYMIARAHNEMEIILRDEIWWAYVQAYSRRDQISLPVVFMGYPVGIIPAGTRSRLATIKRHALNDR